MRYNVAPMSFTRKIIDSARTSINTVMDRVAADDTPLSHVDEAELQRELERRIAARQSETRGPLDNPRARLAGASEAARQKRMELAHKRAERVRAVREKRERAARAAQEEFIRRAREEAGRAAAGSRAGASSSGRSSSSSSSRSSGSWSDRASGRGFPFQRKDDKIAGYYRVLDLPYGAEFAEVKAAYRKLMRKYHPDRHAGNPKKQKAATELTMRVTQAYNALEQHLKG